MNQLRIRRCQLRLRRHGGWSWGPDPSDLLRKATSALPDLITQKLAQLLADQDEPLTLSRLAIRVPVKLTELTEFSNTADNSVQSLLSTRISMSLRQALAVQAGIEDFDPPEIQTPDTSENALTLSTSHDGVALLVRWYEEGNLIRLLRYFSDQAVAAWERLSLKSLPPVSVSVEMKSKLTEIADQLCRNLAEPPDGRLSRRGWRLVLLAALLQENPQQVSSETVARLLDEFLPISTDESARPMEQPLLEELPREESVPTSGDDMAKNGHARRRLKNVTASSDGDARIPENFQLEVGSVLPFVSMGVLSRLGYFDVLVTALKAAGRATDISCFVVALAYKMLPHPHRGWHREAADQRTASAVANLQVGLSGEEIDRFAYLCVDFLSPVDAYLQLLLNEGHDPSRAVLIHRQVSSGQPLWLLLDSQGGFPLGWFSTLPTMLETLDDFAGNTFLVNESAADPSLFSALVDRRHRFVTALPPGREDHWRPVDRFRTLWTNDWDVQQRWLQTQSGCLQVVTEAAERVTQALLVERPALPAIQLSRMTEAQRRRSEYAVQFEQTLALAAASALGTIAWKLWGENEPTDPLLALERLGNLDGKISVEGERVIVRPAFGRRYQDLHCHNLLVDVENLPWLGGRRLEFAGL